MSRELILEGECTAEFCSLGKGDETFGHEERVLKWSLLRAAPEDKSLGDFIFQLHGGSTGWESFYAKQWIFEEMCETGWPACAGTPGSWKRCFLSAETMKTIWDEIKSLVY